MNFDITNLVKNKKFWIIIASVFGGLIIACGSCIGCAAYIVGTTSNSNSESEISESSDMSSSDIKENDKIYTVDEFCQLFEDDDKFANNHKGETFTVIGTIRQDRDVPYGQIRIRSSFTSEKHRINYWIYFHFKDNKVLDGLGANDKVKLSGTLNSYLTTSGFISLNDCTIISVENSTLEDSSTKSQPEISNPESPNSSTSEPVSSVSSIEPPQSSTESAPESISTSTATTPPATTPPPISSSKPQTTMYVLNTKRKVVHVPSCRDVDKIADENYSTTSDIGWAKSNGYKSCGHCNPY